MAKTTPNTHNGRAIVGRKMELRQMGGAFSADLLVANPDLLAQAKTGTELTLAVRVACIDEHFPGEDRKNPAEGGVLHVLIFDPRTVTVVEDSAVSSTFDAQAAAVQKAKDDAAGNVTVQESIADALEAAHLEGDHQELVEDCPLCDWEGEVKDSEDAADAAEKDGES